MSNPKPTTSDSTSMPGPLKSPPTLARPSIIANASDEDSAEILATLKAVGLYSEDDASNVKTEDDAVTASPSSALSLLSSDSSSSDSLSSDPTSPQDDVSVVDMTHDSS